MIPSKSYKHLYELQTSQALTKVAGAAAVALLLNAVVVLLFVLPAYNRYNDAAQELAAQRTVLDALQQKPIVQQATESGIASITKRLPPRLLLSELTATIQEAAVQRGVLYVKLQQEAGQQTDAESSSAAADHSNASDSSTPGSQASSQFRLTVYGDLQSLIAFGTQLQHEEQLMVIDTIQYTKLDEAEGSAAVQLLAQLPSWRAGRIGYSLELTFRAFELPESLSALVTNTSVAMN